jgi:tyrosyl-tRNA synthetase
MAADMANFKSETMQILSERGFINQCTDFEGLDNAFKAGPVTAYIGYDPTAVSLHIGHLVTIMMMYWLQQTGNRPLTLMGGATALVGDPSFKDASRPLMTEETIVYNIEGIKKVFGLILRYGNGPNDSVMVNNADWLKGLGYIEFLRDYGVHFSVNRMLSFDSVKLRLEREQHLSFLEFNYMLMQAFDFVELYKTYGCTLQVSGADQWGNVVNGIELGRKKENVTLYGLTTALLTDANGKKMGKSEGNALWLNPELQSDYEYYQYWRNVDDAMVEKMLKIFTTLPMDEIARLSSLQGAEINEAKKVLAFEATTILRGRAAAEKSAATALETFAGSGRGADLPKINLTLDDSLSIVELLVRTELAPSKGEARRLIKGNGVRVNDEPVTDEAMALNDTHFSNDNTAKLSAGKKRHVLIVKA